MPIGNRFISLLSNSGFAAAASLIVLVACSRWLSPDDYGLYRKFFLCVEIVAPILGLGLSQAVFRFFPDYKRIELLKLCVILIASSSIVFFILFSFPGRSFIFKVVEGDLDGLEFIYLLGVIYSVFLPVLISFYVDSGKIKRFAVVNAAFSFLSTVLILCVCYSTRSYEQVIFAKVLLGFLFVSIMTLLYKIQFGDGAESKKSSLSVVKLIKFSLPVGAASIVSVLSQSIDKLFVARFETAEVYAVYVNGAIEVPLISLVSGALSTSAIGYMSLQCAKGNKDLALKAFKSVAENSCLFLMPVFVFLLINSKDFIVVLFGKEYVDSWKPFFIYLFLLPIRVVMYGPALIALGQSRVIMYRGVLELIFNFFLSALFYFYFGVLGLAVATVLVVCLWSVPYNLKNIKEGFGVGFKDVLPYGKIIRALFFSLCLAPLAYYPGRILLDQYTASFFINLISYMAAMLSLYFVMGVVSIKRIKRGLGK